MAKREILILSSWYPTKSKPFLGNFVVRHAQLLNKEHNITVINTIPSDTSKKLFLEENNRYGYRELQVIHPRGKNLYSKKRWQKKALKLAFLETNNFDLIIGHVLLPKGLQFVVSKKNFECPLILVEHGSYYREGVRKNLNRFQEFILKYTRKYFDEIIAVSHFLKQDIQADFPIHEINVIGNHIDTVSFNIGSQHANEKTEFLHISTLDRATKNPKGILEACDLLLKDVSNFHVTIICDEDYTEWMHETDKQGLSKNISFEGPKQWKDLVTDYQKSDAFILNSDYESFSIVLAEACATGTPVISTPVGIAYNLDSNLGYQTECNNPISLKEAMLMIIQKQKKFSPDDIRKQALQYSEQSILEQWNKTINKHVK